MGATRSTAIEVTAGAKAAVAVPATIGIGNPGRKPKSLF